jgi:hypothetical protein
MLLAMSNSLCHKFMKVSNMKQENVSTRGQLQNNLIKPFGLFCFSFTFSRKQASFEVEPKTKNPAITVVRSIHLFSGITTSFLSVVIPEG